MTSNFEDLLRVYYSRVFPYEPYVNWLGAGNVDKQYFSKREMSFTLQDDIYLRYLSFNNAEDLKAEMVNRLPHKIDIGAVFNARPSDHNKVRDFQPVEKELVFDIDMTDYDDVRTCCSGANICLMCWEFMTVAIKVLDRALREDFGFNHLLWVYSGRRGIHCWVSDARAKALGPTARSAVAEYLQILRGGEGKAKKVSIYGEPHPFVAQSIEIVKKHFRKLCLEGQDMLGTEERENKILSMIPHEDLRKNVRAAFSQESSSTGKWDAFLAHLESFNNNAKSSKVRRLAEEIMLQFAYPRLDINVSKGLNHLLKSPFCVHPKTGRVCIPIDPLKADSFNPMTVPTISQITDEIDKFAKEESHKVVTKDYQKTSLKEPMTLFNKFITELSNKEWRGKKIDASW